MLNGMLVRAWKIGVLSADFSNAIAGAFVIALIATARFGSSFDHFNLLSITNQPN